MEIAGDPDSPSGTSGERAEVFWTEKLQALVEPTLVGDALSGASKHAGRAPDGGGQARVQTHLSVEKTGRLARFARQQGVTPNTVLQGAWLLLLQRYCGNGQWRWSRVRGPARRFPRCKRTARSRPHPADYPEPAAGTIGRRLAACLAERHSGNARNPTCAARPHPAPGWPLRRGSVRFDNRL